MKIKFGKSWLLAKVLVFPDVIRNSVPVPTSGSRQKFVIRFFLEKLKKA